MRRLEHRLDHQPGAGDEIVRPARLTLEQTQIELRLTIGERPAERLETELPHEFLRANRVGRRLGLAGDQSVSVSTAKRGQCEPLGRFAVGFRLQRRDSLPLQLILEAVDEVLFGEPVGRLGLVSQKVADGVVVLAVSQPAHGERPQGKLLGTGNLFSRLAHLFVR